METIVDQRPKPWPLLVGAALVVTGVVLIPLVQPYLGVPAAVVGILLLAYGIDRRLSWRRPDKVDTGKHASTRSVDSQE